VYVVIYLTNFIVGVTNISPNNVAPIFGGYSVCAQYPGYPLAGSTVSVYCQPYTPPGQYVIIQTPGTQYLSFCELEVHVYNQTKKSIEISYQYIYLFFYPNIYFLLILNIMHVCWCWKKEQHEFLYYRNGWHKHTYVLCIPKCKLYF